MADLSSAQLQRSADISLLLKSKKQHYEQQVEKLISYIGEEYRQIDPLALLGKRFREKEEEFSSLRRENQELLRRTKNLAEDIQRLRGSQDSGIHWEDLRISLEQTQKLDNVVPSREDTAFNSSIYSRLEGLQSELIQARISEQEEDREYDKVIEWAMTYLTRDRTAWRLANQVRQMREREDEDMVMVPRKRYEQLVKIYSINIAEASINKLRQEIVPMKSVSISPQIEQKGINYIEQIQRTYYQNYCDIARDQKFDFKDLHQLFQALAKKVGFENEWRRYHLENQNNAVSFKHKIDIIFQFATLGKEIKPEVKDHPKLPLGRFEFRQLLEKFDKLIHELPFERAEKEEWKQLSQKIKEDRLVSMDSFVDRYHRMLRDETKTLVSKASSLLYSTVQQSLNQFSKIVCTKLKMRNLIWGQKLKELMSEPLFEAVQAKIKDDDGADVWAVLHEVAAQKINKAFGLLSKNFIFISGANLYNAAINKK